MKRLLQAYFDRWQIEINHREEKHWLGVGQAQVWSKQSVPRHPAFVVACYSLLWLASLRASGSGSRQSFDCRLSPPNTVLLLDTIARRLSASNWRQSIRSASSGMQWTHMAAIVRMMPEGRPL